MTSAITEAQILLEALRHAATDAGELLRRAEPGEYGDTGLDRRLEQRILTTLTPILGNGALVLAEESTPETEAETGAAPERGDALVVYIDPLDGSRALQTGWREASIALAVSREQRWLAALVEAPLLTDGSRAHGDRIEWCMGSPVFRNGRAIDPCLPRGALQGTALIAPRQAWAGAVHRALLSSATPVACASTAYRWVRAAVGDVAVSLDWLPAGRSLKAWDVACGLAIGTCTGAVTVCLTGPGQPPGAVSIRGANLCPANARVLVTGAPAVVDLVAQRYAGSLGLSALDRLFEAHLTPRRPDAGPTVQP